MADPGQEETFGQQVDLSGVAEEWEESRALRARMREKRRLFQRSGHPDDYNPPAHVKEAAFNHKVLAPLFKRMASQLDDDGNLQLFTIPAVEAETLAHVQCPSV